jgi:endonuclease/exonuclease/phosphatase (EEP) superfamily protein YafD
VSSALLAVLCLAGAVSGWCDVLNSFAPFWALAAALVLFGALRRRRLNMLLLAVFGLAVPLCLILPDIVAAARDTRTDTQGPRALKLVSFNVWNSNVAPDRTAALILKQDADLIGLEEDMGTFGAEETKLRRIYPYAVHCTQASDGCSLWSKRPFLASGEMTAPPYGMALAWGRTTAPDGKPVTVVVVHLAWPFPPHIKKLEMDRLAAFLKPFDPNETIVAGDFNQTPWSFGLRYLGERLRPLTRRTHALFSWPAFVSPLRIHTPFGLLPIDQVYAAPAFAKASVKRLPASGSDHFGLIATFAPRP